MDIAKLDDSPTGQLAKAWAKSLDKIVGIYIDPKGKIAINGVRRGRVVYRTFSSY